MKEKILKLRGQIIALAYQKILKPVLFKFDPEFVHDRFILFGCILGSNPVTRWAVKMKFDYTHPMLEQDILGIHFKNPIGLAAGFDKNAQLTKILPEVGLGFEEIGSVTGEPCAGNEGKRLWRVPEKKSLLVYYGLKNDGSEVIADRLRSEKFRFPIGVSVAKTNCQATAETAAGIADYVKAYRAFEGVGDYVTINISCPNAFGGQPFNDVESLTQLLKEIKKNRRSEPIFVKMSPNLSHEVLKDLIEVALQYGVDGFILSNLNKDHDFEKGGLSGKAVEDLSNDNLRYIYRLTKGKVPLVGCGGVFTAENAYKKIRSGASLIQMITGMIYQGPQVIGQINQGLVELLKKDGFSNIQEAIGVDVEL